MWRFWGRVFLILILFSFVGFGEDLKKICNEKILKETLNKKLILSSCQKIAENELNELYEKYNQEEESEEYANAIETLKKIIVIRQKYQQVETEVISIDYSNLSLLYTSQGEYTKALKFSQSSLRISKKIFGTNHHQTAVSYSNLAYIYEKISKFEEAKKYNLVALKIFKKLYGENNLAVATTYNNLAFLYSSTGNYYQSLELYKKSLKIDKELSDDKSSSISITLNNIGELYSILGEYPKAMQNYQDALAIDIQNYGETHTVTAYSYNNIAQIHELLEDYQRAQKYYQKALDIAQAKLHKNHPFLSTLHGNLGNLYYVMEEDKKSFQEHKKALDIRLFLSKGDVTTDLALSYHAMGLLYQKSQDYNKSLEYFEKTLNINNQLLSKDNIANSKTYSSMGMVYQQMGKKEEALEFYMKSLNLEKKILGKNHRDLARSYNSLSLLYFSKKNYRLAYDYTKKAFEIFKHNNHQNFTLLDNTQRVNYTKKRQYYFNNLLYLTNLNKHNTNFRFTINHWLNYKGTLFEYQNILSILETNPKTSLKTKKLLKNLKRKTKQLNYQKKQFITDSKKIKTIEKKIHNIEVRLSEQNDKLKNLLKLNQINISKISKKLHPSQLYIDFAKGNDNYYIFTLDHNNNINFLQIDENDTKKIDLNIQKFHHNSKEMAKMIKDNSLTLNLREQSKEIAKNILQELYTSIIDKYLKKIIKDKKHLIISPDGLLNFLPFEALYNKKNYLIEKYKVSYISSGKELLRQVIHQPRDKTSKVIVFGSPNFWFNSQASSPTKSTVTKDNATIFDMQFNALEISKEEINIMRSYYPQLQIYSDNNASVENLFKIKSPKILHISTHGFFLNNKKNPNPMLASGLAFAGANYANFKDDARGIATALQLTGLELQNTELVVLSACETALGKIHNAEGVTGLSKAFIQAGAKKVIMSLWKVSSRETVTLMQDFYANIHAENNYEAALRQAKLQMITKHPYYWSAFIMSGI